ncbi:MAG: AAA family ATPase [Dehalococcoidia bacterium]|nr:AAA family ATPase [Dehalococcoidia bacterium]MSQ34381.1 AAA family ATPase [Dehalococcoidia bacterium]
MPLTKSFLLLTVRSDVAAKAHNVVSKGGRHLVPATERIVDNLEAFMSILPESVQRALKARGDVDDLIEVVMDLGRVPEARFPGGQVLLSDDEVTQEGIQSVIESLGAFGDDNRAGIQRTLHRFSVMRNRAGDPIGLTCRVGRAVFGSVKLIEDLVRSGDSILLLGRPGVGKTTMLREVARVIADDIGKRAVIVDTSNEIAGDGDVPHPAIGHARRMQVPRTELQHKVMIEAVENHMPEVIIIDEMSTDLEAQAARTIAERGVQLVATAHGNTLENLISNPSLSDLVGGTQSVTLGDMEARRRGTQKTVLERKHEPTFDIVIEIRERNNVAVHREVGTIVDLLLRGYPPAREVRWMDSDGTVHTGMEEATEAAPEIAPPPFDLRDVQRPHGPRRRLSSAPDSYSGQGEREALPVVGHSNGNGIGEQEAPVPLGPPVRIYPFGIPRSALKEVIIGMGVPATVTDAAEEADFFMTTKAHYNRRPTAVRDAEKLGVPVYVLRRGTAEQLGEFLRRFGSTSPRPSASVAGQARRQTAIATVDNDRRYIADSDEEQASADPGVRNALEEARGAVDRIMGGERKVALSPQSAFIRRLQHGMAARYNLGSASAGRDPARRVIIRKRR